MNRRQFTGQARLPLALAALTLAFIPAFAQAQSPAGLGDAEAAGA